MLFRSFAEKLVGRLLASKAMLVFGNNTRRRLGGEVLEEDGFRFSRPILNRYFPGGSEQWVELSEDETRDGTSARTSRSVNTANTAPAVGASR